MGLQSHHVRKGLVIAHKPCIQRSDEKNRESHSRQDFRHRPPIEALQRFDPWLILIKSKTDLRPHHAERSGQMNFSLKMYEQPMIVPIEGAHMSEQKAQKKKSAAGKKKHPKTQTSRDRSADEVSSLIENWRGKGRLRKPRHRYEINSGCSTAALHLTHMGLTSIPEEVRNLHELEALNLTGNRIEELPDWIGELKSLRLLGLSNNKLKEVPDSPRSKGWEQVRVDLTELVRRLKSRTSSRKIQSMLSA